VREKGYLDVYDLPWKRNIKMDKKVSPLLLEKLLNASIAQDHFFAGLSANRHLDFYFAFQGRHANATTQNGSVEWNEAVVIKIGALAAEDLAWQYIDADEEVAWMPLSAKWSVASPLDTDLHAVFDPRWYFDLDLLSLPDLAHSTACAASAPWRCYGTGPIAGVASGRHGKSRLDMNRSLTGPAADFARLALAARLKAAAFTRRAVDDRVDVDRAFHALAGIEEIDRDGGFDVIADDRPSSSARAKGRKERVENVRLGSRSCSAAEKVGEAACAAKGG
jgi:hypothetical protein